MKPASGTQSSDLVDRSELARTTAPSTRAETANPTSNVDDTITRSEVRDRAQFWVDRSVPYSENANYPDPQGRNYRTDCSGYISMAWHLGESANTASLLNYSTRLNSFDDLEQGDALDRTGPNVPWDVQHVVLFDHWADSSRQVAVVYTEPHEPLHAQIETWARAKLTDLGYIPIRYNKIAEEDLADVPQWQWDRLLDRVLRMSEGVEGQDFNGDQFNLEQGRIDEIMKRLDHIQAQLPKTS